MKPLDDSAHRFAETAARLIVKAEEIDLPNPLNPPVTYGSTTSAVLRLLARAYVELRDKVRELHDLVDQTDPNDSIGAALTKVGLERRPTDQTAPKPLLVVKSPEQVKAMRTDELLAIYCCVMRETAAVFSKYETCVVRVWDGMDGCWIDCTKEVSQEEALRYWAERTNGGARRVSYDEIDYYRIFPGGTRMHWDGSEGQELHRCP